MSKASQLFLVLILVSGCGSDDPVKSSLDEETIEQYLANNGLSFSVTSEGVYKYEVVANPIGNSSGDVFSIYYTLSNLETGTIIDSHLVGDGDPIKLKQNASSIFPQGSDYGLVGIIPI